MIAVLFVFPCFLYLSDGICIEKKRKCSLAYDVVNIRHIIFEEQSDLGNSMSF